MFIFLSLFHLCLKCYLELNEIVDNLENVDIYHKGEIIDMIQFFQKRNKKKEISDKKEISKDNNDTNEKNNIEMQINELSLGLKELSIQLEKINSKRKRKSIIEFFSFILLLFTAFGGAFAYLHTQFSNINDKIDVCLKEEDIVDLRTSVKGIESWILGDIADPNKIGANERFNNIEDNLKIISDRLNMLPINVTESMVATNLKYATSMENSNNNTNTTLTPETCLGEDSNGEKYSIGDIIGKPVLLTYNENDKEVYFYGQINEKLHWEGDCITNVYNNDGTLYGICESNFDDGVRKKYESFYLSSTENEWIYTNRECTKNGNLGISERFSFQYNKLKNFTKTNARIYDLLYVIDFSDLNDKILLTHYYGYTSNGEYNDQFNDEQHISYEIIYNPDGKVNILYIGEFVNGQFYDQTKNAIEIVYDSSSKDYKYFCYKGTFTNGNRDGKVSSNNYVTQEQIDEILKNKKINLTLDWY